MVSQEQKQSLVNKAILIGVIIIFLGTLPLVIALGKGGFNFESVQKIFLTYSAIGAVALIGIIAFIFVEQVIVRQDKKFGSGVGFHSPGDKPSLKIRFFTNTTDILLLSLIIFSGLGLIATITNQTFTGAGTLIESQFTELDNALFRWLIIPVSENLSNAFVIAFIIFSIRTIARKFKWNSGTFWFISIISAVGISALFGVVNHLSRYSGQETALFNVGIFWAIGGLITVLSGSFIPFWIMHISNNLFFDLGRLFSSDSVVLATIGFILIISFIYGIRLFRGRKK